jgi:urea transport system permease protein
MAKVMIFILIILFLQIKPAGIFAPKGRTAEL